MITRTLRLDWLHEKAQEHALETLRRMGWYYDIETIDGKKNAVVNVPTEDTDLFIFIFEDLY